MVWRINVLLGLMVAFLLAGAPSWATGASLVWEPPTTRVDGTPLPAAEIGMYEICVASDSTTCAEGGTTAPRFYEALASPVPIESLDLPAGSWYFTIRTVDTNGLASEWADPVSYTIVAPPNPPTALQIE
jgi:hypothetical protein